MLTIKQVHSLKINDALLDYAYAVGAVVYVIDIAGNIIHLSNGDYYDVKDKAGITDFCQGYNLWPYHRETQELLAIDEDKTYAVTVTRKGEFVTTVEVEAPDALAACSEVEHDYQDTDYKLIQNNEGHFFLVGKGYKGYSFVARRL